MTLADFTRPALIIPHLRGEKAAFAIKELSHVLGTENCVPDVLRFYQAALNREFMSGTDIDGGMAFPHARVPGVKQVAFALGRSSEPLRWSPRAAESVRLVFLLAVPATDATQYFQLVSGLIRLSKDVALMNRIFEARDESQIFEVLQQVTVRPPANAHRTPANE